MGEIFRMACDALNSAIPGIFGKGHADDIVEIAVDARQEQLRIGLEGFEDSDGGGVVIDIDGHEADRGVMRSEKRGQGFLDQPEIIARMLNAAGAR